MRVRNGSLWGIVFVVAGLMLTGWQSEVKAEAVNDGRNIVISSGSYATLQQLYEKVKGENFTYSGSGTRKDPYLYTIIETNLIIEKGASLTISSETLKIKHGKPHGTYGITVKGTLNIKGTPGLALWQQDAYIALCVAGGRCSNLIIEKEGLLNCDCAQVQHGNLLKVDGKMTANYSNFGNYPTQGFISYGDIEMNHCVLKTNFGGTVFIVLRPRAGKDALFTNTSIVSNDTYCSFVLNVGGLGTRILNNVDISGIDGSTGVLSISKAKSIIKNCKVVLRDMQPDDYSIGGWCKGATVLNTDFDPDKVRIVDEDNSLIPYWYLFVKVMDEKGNPVTGAKVDVKRDDNITGYNEYIPKNAPVLTQDGNKVTPAGQTPIPQDGEAIIVPDCVMIHDDPSGSQAQFTYTISVSKEGYESKIIKGVNPDRSWYRNVDNVGEKDEKWDTFPMVYVTLDKREKSVFNTRGILNTLFSSSLVYAEEVTKKGPITVGIYNGGKTLGATGINEALKTISDVKPTLITNFNQETICNYDLLILPHVNRLGAEKANWRELLIHYVRTGHGILMFHDTCGFRKAFLGKPLFPEVLKGIGKTNTHTMIVKDKSNPITQGLPKEFEHDYWDHINLEAGHLGKVLVIDKEGHPVVITGKVKEGKVIGMGNICGWSSDDKEKAPVKGELRLLVNAVRWLGKDVIKSKPLSSPQLALKKIKFQAEIKKEIRDYILAKELVFAGYNLETKLDLLGIEIKRLKDKAEAGFLKEFINRLEELRKERERNLLTLNKKLTLLIDKGEKVLEQRLDKAATDEELEMIKQDVQRDKERYLQIIAEGRSELLKKIASLKAEVMNLKNERGIEAPIYTMEEKPDVWYKEHFIRMFINHYGFPIPGIPEALTFLGEAGVNVLVENRLFRDLYFNERRPREPEDSEKLFLIRKKCKESLDWIDYSCKRFFPYKMRDKHFYEQFQFPEEGDKCLEAYFDLAQKNNLRIFSEFSWPRTNSKWTGVKGEKFGRWFDFGEAEAMAELKKRTKLTIEKSGNHPAFLGISFDEPIFKGGWSFLYIEKFRDYLKNKYSTKELEEMGINDIETVIFPLPNTDKEEDKLLWMEHRDFCTKVFEKGMKELYNYAHSLKEDIVVQILLMPNDEFQFGLGRPYAYSFAFVSPIGDIMNVDPYYLGTIEEAFAIELMRANAKGPVVITCGAGYGGTVETWKRDMAIAYAHADGIYVFEWPNVWKQKRIDYPSAIKRYVPGMWEPTRETLKKMSKIEKYLVKTKSASKTALLFSERTNLAQRYGKFDRKERELDNYVFNQMGIYCALAQEHVQVDPIFSEGLTEKKLSKYKVLILSDTSSLTPEEINIIREWVRNGGQLIATAGTTILDKWGRKQTDYLLADLFGASYLDTREAEGHIDMKIDKTQADRIKIGDKITYDRSYGYDLVRATTGKVLYRWTNGMPGIIINNYGKGKVIFVAAKQPGLSYSAKDLRRWSFSENRHKVYLPGIKKLLANSVIHLLRNAGEDLPFTVTNCPVVTESVMRIQPEGNRAMLHFLNYDPNLSLVHGVRASILVPNGKRVKSVYYPDNQKPVSYKVEGKYITFPVRDFSVHEVIAVQWK